jgi:pilus assembly protein Flp/PilA
MAGNGNADAAPVKTFLSVLDRGLRSFTIGLSRLTSERGQTMAEYGILIAVIAIVVVVAAVLLGGSISTLFKNTSSHL